MSTMIASEQSLGGTLNRVKETLQSLLRQGLSQKRLALTLALGMTLGLIPTLWGASLVCALVAATFGLNQAAIQLANYLAYPLQILLFVPFMQLGERLFGPGVVFIDFRNLRTALQQDLGATLQSLGNANVKALEAWALCSPLLVALFYFLFAAMLKRAPWSYRKSRSHE